jgi:hypothetical protein
MPELFLIDGDNNLTPLSQSEYDSESLLQQLLADHPALLGGDQMGSGAPRQWLFVAREAPVPDKEGTAGRWSLDHLFLDQDAIPTFVEVKRASDSRIRREVVGQMLDYAANGLRYWPVESIQSFLASRVSDVDQALVEAFGESIDPTAYWQQLRENISEGRVRLLFVADRIPQELLAVVEFLNRQMDHTEVLAVEIPQFTGEGIRTLAPRVLGQTQEAVQRKGGTSPGRKWDEASYFAEIERLYPPEAAAVVWRFYEWNLSKGYRVVWGTGKVNGSFGARVPVGNTEYVPAVCYTAGGIEFELYWMRTWPPFDDIEMRREFVRRLNRVPGANIPEDDFTLENKRPAVRFGAFASDDAFGMLTDAIEWFEAEAKAHVTGEQRS